VHCADDNLTPTPPSPNRTHPCDTRGRGGELPLILAITGPTASGKSSLALEVAESLQTEILSADSMQVYRGMDIGTAKPTPEEQRKIPHHAIDVASPYLPFSVADYCTVAQPVLIKFFEEDRPIVVCGGTGLYLKALFEGLAEAPPPDFDFREKMESRVLEEGTPSLHKELLHIDPEAASKIHPNDCKRIIRALEIHHLTGLTKTAFETQQEPPPWRNRIAWFGLTWPWVELDQRINQRVGWMFEQGLVKEVENLLAGGAFSHTALQGLGYKEVVQHLDGERGLAETIELIKQKTRRFARRQMTWFRPNKEIRWIERKGTDGVAN
jgi:tRNA dimethylallyltransferase